ncbi:unnamed protein product [Haemonchus placei]|uniref:tRNA_int_endo_N domain-containing protein n=1 Tax=Haemonchus placei TaxID=6290 RepID=A0A0N4W6I3_HAEPC|nr:unnamed protein product [Haemonchus placei]
MKRVGVKCLDVGSRILAGSLTLRGAAEALAIFENFAVGSEYSRENTSLVYYKGLQEYLITKTKRQMLDGK